MPTLPSAAANPREWLADYFHTRERLASSHSDFRCDPACTRPGCKKRDLLVQVSIVDLLGAAGYLQEPVSAVYRRYCSLGLFPNERTDWIWMVGLKLKKPCPFLENDLCGIYPVRPLPCILFPEYLVPEGKFEAYAGNQYFRDFLCFKSPLHLSPERAGIMAQIKKMWIKETLISGFYLFNHGSCHLDFGNLTSELIAAAATRPGEEETAESPEPGRPIPNRVLEGFFLERMASLPPFAGVEEKIGGLDKRETQEQFLEWLQDDRLYLRLKQSEEEWALIYRFKRGKLKARRRSLLPGEYKFY